MTQRAGASRIQSATAKQHGGMVPKGSLVPGPRALLPRDPGEQPREWNRLKDSENCFAMQLAVLRITH